MDASDWRRGDATNVASLLRAIDCGEVELAYLFTSGLDGVMHAHRLHEAYQREYGDTFAGAAAKSQVRLRPTDWVYGLAFATMKDAAQDLGWCRQQRRLRDWPHAVGVRLAQRLGKIIGFRKGRSHYHDTTKQVQ
jgi:hypothetical protein